MGMYRIAIVDDDVHIGNMVEEVLQKEGYKTCRAYSGTEALFLLEKEKPDLLLLDLMLPGLSGEEVLEKTQGIPVIVISAKSEVSDKVELLLAGAADYLTKPFAIEELLARIAVQRRKRSGQEEAETLSYEDITLDMVTHEVMVRNQGVHLTKTEFAILRILLSNPKQIVTKSLLLDYLSEDVPDCMESSLKVHVSNLRKKLREISGKDYIEAVWGIGFKLRED